MAKTDVRLFTITAQEKVSKWQNVTYVVEATSEEQAKELIEENPKGHCVNVDEVLDETENVLEVDFTNNYTCEVSED